MKPGKKNGWQSLVSLPWKDDSATNFCMFSTVESEEDSLGKYPVYLNVYDLTPVNECLYWAGIGAFRTGIEVHGIEYAFGSHAFPASGVFEVDPHECPGFKFRKSILIGTTSLNDDQVTAFMDFQSLRYYGNTYHLVDKNCNHFCADVCYKLTGNHIPEWVNRLARIGSKCTKVLPKSLKRSRVWHNSDSKEEARQRKRLRGSFSCFSSIHLSNKEVALPSMFINSYYKDCLPSWRFRRPKHDSCKDA